jgi:hypothetical protein
MGTLGFDPHDCHAPPTPPTVLKISRVSPVVCRAAIGSDSGILTVFFELETFGSLASFIKDFLPLSFPKLGHHQACEEISIVLAGPAGIKSFLCRTDKSQGQVLFDIQSLMPLPTQRVTNVLMIAKKMEPRNF